MNDSAVGTRKSSLSTHLNMLVGQPVAIMCARYNYRGIVAEVGDDHVVLSNASMVEISGRNSNDKPDTEDPFFGSVAISLFAVEQVSQPNWVHAPIPGSQ